MMPYEVSATVSSNRRISSFEIPRVPYQSDELELRLVRQARWMVHERVEGVPQYYLISRQLASLAKNMINSGRHHDMFLPANLT